MRLVRDAARVWFDAGPFFRFSEARKLRELARYLGPKVHWTVDVANEIERRSTSPNPRVRTHPGLQDLQRFGFPAHPPEALSGELRARAAVIAADWAAQEEDAHPLANRGEIGTVLLAAQLGGELVVLDDAQGVRLAQLHGVPFLRTTHLVCEMVEARTLSLEEGLDVYLRVRRRKPLTEEGYRTALKRYGVRF